MIKLFLQDLEKILKIQL